MAIRKDLDDMLNNLKTGGATVQRKSEPAEQPAAKPLKPRKSVYDDMSVDDLLFALKDDKKSAPKQPAVSEVKPQPAVAAPEKADEASKAVPDKAPEPEVKQNTVRKQKGVDPELEKKLAEALMPGKKSASKAEEKSEEMPSPEKKEAEKAEVTEDKPAEESLPKKRKSRKIVISGELPDYEAIRREELEKDRIERERAAAAAKSAAQKANELTPVEAIAAEAMAAAEAKSAGEDNTPAEESIPEPEIPQEVPAAAEETVVEETPAEEVREEKQKGGFFSKRKNKRKESKEDELKEFEAAVEDSAYSEPVEFPQYTFVEETYVVSSSSNEVEDVPFSISPEMLSEPESTELTVEQTEELPEEQPQESAEDIPEELLEDMQSFVSEPTVDELLDAAIAGIEQAQTAEAALVEGEAVHELESVIESDAADEFTEEMREDTETAIAEIESDEISQPTEEVSAEENTAEDTPAENQPKPKRVLRRILDEEPGDIINERSEKPEADDENAVGTKEKGSFKKRLYTILGAVFAVFAVIGIITVIAKGVGLFHRFTTGEVKKDGFTELVYPAVIMDIEAFNNPSELTSNQMITAAIWSIVMSEERVSKYSVSPGTDTIFIPYMDVEARAVEMFGQSHPEFEHCTVGPLESRFVYADGAYNVKLNPITFTYSPEIKSIVKSGSKYTLTVDYIDELPVWMEKSVAKTVEFKLTEKEDGTYTIDSMEIKFVKSSNV